MNVKATYGSIVLELERPISPDELTHLIRNASAYWPHTAEVDTWTMQYIDAGRVNLSLTWRVRD